VWDIPIFEKEFGDWDVAEDLWALKRGFAEYFLVAGGIFEIRLKGSTG